ncbi:hypothetical protein Tco_0929610 [Tanacetum coccineum]
MYPPPHLSQPQISHLFVPPSQQYQSHQTSSVPLIAYNLPQASTQPLTEFPQMDSGLAILVFNQGDDAIACLSKAMYLFTVVASLRFPSTNNQLRTSSNLRNQATIQDGMVTVQQVQGRKGKSYAGNSYKGNATSSGVNNAGGHAKTEDLDAYDSNCDDVSNAKAVLMANLSNYGSDVILEEKANQEKNNESLTAELERYKERVKTFEQRLNIDLSTHEKMTDSQMDDIFNEKLVFKQQIDSLEQNISNQIKETESLFQTFIVFKNESKQKESKYIDKEIDLEKKIKELDNIVYKVGKSAQTVHMFIKPQVFYDDAHKQALGYQNPFYFKKAQRIKPTLYDGSVISSQHGASPVIDDEEILILEKTSHPNTDQSASSPVKIEALWELPKLQAKDTTICKLKELIKYMRENDMEEKVKHEMDEIETINIELEHCVAKLLYENERLHKEIEHLKKIYKDQFDLIKKIRALSKEHGDSLIAQLNSKSMENADLKRQIQDKVFVTTSLKNDLRKLKGKEIIENTAQIPIATTIAPGMLKIDLDPLTLSEKLIDVTPMKKVKKVQFSKPPISSRNIQQVESSKTPDSNTPVLSSIGLKCSTSTCRS